MPDRRTALRLLAVALLVFGLAYEVGHLRHHLEHAHLHADADHAAHRECLIFHTGALVEAVVDAPPCGETSLPAPPPAATRPVAAALRLLPEPRAPPATC